MSQNLNYTQDDKVILLAYERRLKLLQNYVKLDNIIIQDDTIKLGGLCFSNEGLITGGKSGDQVYKVNTIVNNNDVNYELEKMVLKIFKKKNKRHFREIYNQIMFQSFSNIGYIPCPKVYLQGQTDNGNYFLLMENVMNNVYSFELEEYIINISNSKENLCIQKYPPDSTESLPNPYIIEYDIIENIFLQLFNIIKEMITNEKIVYNHCDIHPKNVIINNNDVILIDFGEARNLIKKTNKTFKACDKGRYATMKMNEIFSTKTINFLEKKFLGKKSVFSILSREIISLIRKDNFGKVDLRFLYMNLYLYLLLSDNIDKVKGLMKDLKTKINSFNPLKKYDDILTKIEFRIKNLFSFLKKESPEQSISLVNTSEGIDV